MRALILAAIFAAVPLAANAQTFPSCRILTEAIDFGVYDTLSPAPVLSSGRIEVICLTSGVTPTARVTLSTGQSGVFEDRTLTSGGAELRYNLYVDAARRQIAGDGLNGTSALIPSAAGLSLRQFRNLGAARVAFRIYAAVPPGQAVPAGDYQDVIRVMIEF